MSSLEERLADIELVAGAVALELNVGTGHPLLPVGPMVRARVPPTTVRPGQAPAVHHATPTTMTTEQRELAAELAEVNQAARTAQGEELRELQARAEDLIARMRGTTPEDASP